MSLIHHCFCATKKRAQAAHTRKGATGTGLGARGGRLLLKPPRGKTNDNESVVPRPPGAAHFFVSLPLRPMTTSTVLEFNLSGLHEKHTVRANVPPPLSELCVRVLAANFSTRPTLRGIAPRYINRMTELLPTSLPLEVTGPLIDDEGYWKRSALARWDNCQISSHGSSWKRLYFERNLSDFLELFDPKLHDTEDLTRTLAISKDYIFSLHVCCHSGSNLTPAGPRQERRLGRQEAQP